MKKIFFPVFVLFLICKVCFALEVKQRADVQIGIFDAAQIDIDYQYSGSRFNISTIVQTINLFNTLYSFEGEYASTGYTLGSKLICELYQTRTKTRNHLRTKKILYDKNGVAYKRVSTKDNKTNTRSIDNVPKTADAADMQSVFAELIGKIKNENTCQLKREIYDGKKHYKMIIQDKGENRAYFEPLKKEVGGKVCELYIENLKNNNDNILWEVSADKPIKILFGQDEITKMPFVLEIKIDSTPLGTLKVTPRTLEIK